MIWDNYTSRKGQQAAGGCYGEIVKNSPPPYPTFLLDLEDF